MGMAEDNARDMKRLRNTRTLHSSLCEYLREAEHMRADVRNLLTVAAVKLREEAEHIEAVWN